MHSRPNIVSRENRDRPANSLPPFFFFLFFFFDREKRNPAITLIDDFSLFVSGVFYARLEVCMLLIVAVLFGKDKENGGKNLEVCRNFECTGEITKMESVMNIFLKERKSLSGHSEAISLIIITKRINPIFNLYFYIGFDRILLERRYVKDIIIN